MTNEMRFVKTLTYETAMGINNLKDDLLKQKKLELAKAGGFLAVVSGNVYSHSTKATVKGDRTTFNGTFVARNDKTGEVLETARCYLDKTTAETVKAEFESRKPKDGAIAEDYHISFCLQIGLQLSDASPTGYTWVVKPIMSPQAADEKSALIGKFPALPAPAKKAA